MYARFVSGLFVVLACVPSSVQQPSVAQPELALTNDEAPVPEPAAVATAPEPKPEAAPNPEPAPKPEPKPELPPRPDPETLETLEDVRAYLRLPTLASARAYAINVHTEEPDRAAVLVDDIGGLNPDRSPKDGARLSDTQLVELVKLATRSGQFGAAFCFYPHHAVAFVDDAGETLAELTICFMCGRVSSGVEGLGPDADFDGLEALMRKLKVPLDLPRRGLPPSHGRAVIQADVEHSLHHCQHERGSETPEHPAFELELLVDESGAVSELLGLDDSKVGRCLDELLRRHNYDRAKAASVHRFELAAASKSSRR